MKTLILLAIIASTASTNMTVTSPAFKANGKIPSKYTCTGDNTNPEIDIANIPDKTKSLALILDDPDADNGTFDHWIMWNIPVKEKISANSAPGMQGKNGKGESKYTGPCPPTGTHHYHFKVYALDTKLELPLGTDKDMLIQAMEGHILASSEMIGLYKK